MSIISAGGWPPSPYLRTCVSWCSLSPKVGWGKFGRNFGGRWGECSRAHTLSASHNVAEFARRRQIVFRRLPYFPLSLLPPRVTPPRPPRRQVFPDNWTQRPVLGSEPLPGATGFNGVDRVAQKGPGEGGGKAFPKLMTFSCLFTAIQETRVHNVAKY